jgi:hypothetical protein
MSIARSLADSINPVWDDHRVRAGRQHAAEFGFACLKFGFGFVPKRKPRVRSSINRLPSNAEPQRRPKLLPDHPAPIRV